MKFVSGKTLMISIAILAVAVVSPIHAQAPPQPPTKAPIPLKVDVVISRFQGDKKVSSAPFTLWLSALDPRVGQGYVSVRMGMDVPVGTKSESRPNTAGSTTTTTSEGPNYRYVGTSIDANARQEDDGRFGVDIRVQDSSIFTGSDRAALKVTDPLAFRSFTMNNRLAVRPGQATEYATATDPITGEVVKVEVSVTIVK
jgi:hypothetical protein